MSSKNHFKEIYKEFYPKVLHYVSRLTGHCDYEDITQEVFEKVSRGLEDFKGKSKLSTWIYRIATNTALDRLRSPSFKQNTEELTEQVDDKNVWTNHKKTPIDQQLIRKEMGVCVREHIDKLSPDYKAVIILSELEGFKNQEIAEILQISLDSVKIRLHRARSSLKKILDEACDFYHNEKNILACDRKPTVIKLKKPK
ncbi:MAG: RNA polymerase sigma factor [Thermodesulfovibrionia bacterium]|nr:RNA polymerase sigma factor [Thermodesulfovibrionia bacterium]